MLGDLLRLVTSLNPLHGVAYQFWSGIGSGSPILAGVALMLRHHNCEERRCLRLGRVHPDHGRAVCRRHYHTHAPPAVDGEPQALPELEDT